MNSYTILLSCLLTLSGTRLSAQVHYPDEWWPTGFNEYPDTPSYGNAWIHFQDGTPSVHPANLNMNFEAAVAVASDTLGNVLFYSNGCSIRGADGILLENGEDLNPGELHDWVCDKVGYTAPRSMTALLMPGHPSKWVLLHLGGQYDPARKMVYGPLYLTEIDMAANGGQGLVTDKNIVVAGGDLEPFAIVRHGNGREWWVILPEYGANRYQIRRLSPNGLSAGWVQTIGPAINCRHVGSSTFSPDGSKYARTNSCKAVVMDFDRCTGVFSNPQPLQRDPGMLCGGGLAFTPDNRWLYATTDLCIFRADLAEPLPFLDSLYKLPYVYEDEPPISDYVYGTSLTYMQPAPDGRLYLGSRHRERYFPRFTMLGEDFAFEPEGLNLPVPNVRTLPHFPNFQLFDWQGSICDTLGINAPMSSAASPSSRSFTVRFSPNPFNERLLVSATESGLLRLYSMDSRQILSTLLQIGDNLIETSEMGIGMYTWVFLTDKNGIQVGKLAKARK